MPLMHKTKRVFPATNNVHLITSRSTFLELFLLFQNVNFYFL
jgi:hypothetical protein